MLSRSLQSIAVLRQFDELPVTAGGDVVLFFWLRDVMTCIVGTDNMVTSGMVFPTFNKVELDAFHRNLMRRIIRTSNGFFPI